MIRKPLIAISALLAFTAISGLAYASPQPSDKAWWPNRPKATSEQPSASTPGVWRRSPNNTRSRSKVINPKPDAHRFLGPRGYH